MRSSFSLTFDIFRSNHTTQYVYIYIHHSTRVVLCMLIFPSFSFFFETCWEWKFESWLLLDLFHCIMFSGHRDSSDSEGDESQMQIIDILFSVCEKKTPSEPINIDRPYAEQSVYWIYVSSAVDVYVCVVWDKSNHEMKITTTTMNYSKIKVCAQILSTTQ